VRLAERRWAARLIGIGDIELLRDRARRLRAGVRIVPYIRGRDAAPGTFEVAHFPLAVPAVPGRLDPGNAKAVLATLDAALTGCLNGEFSAMVTAPVQKSVINDAGFAFSGHTEFLAERTGATVVMMLVGATATGPLRVALATTHVPLSAVASAITEALLTRTVRIVADELSAKFRIAKPRIAVCGLNPHAGEGGYLGREEIEIIAPALAALREQGIAVAGPLPADTVFVPANASEFDCVIAMYHDQGLPVLKHASFGHGVNVTLGLPIVRTSVDHGTALDLAADGAGARSADPGSLFAAVELAIELSISAR
jgi:4-hydroxythreonine-4-phosphate dehydrogenase